MSIRHKYIKAEIALIINEIFFSEEVHCNCKVTLLFIILIVRFVANKVHITHFLYAYAGKINYLIDESIDLIYFFFCKEFWVIYLSLGKNLNPKNIIVCVIISVFRYRQKLLVLFSRTTQLKRTLKLRLNL